MVDVEQSGDVRELLVKQSTRLAANLKEMPKNFTIETEFTVKTGNRAYLVWILHAKSAEADQLAGSYNNGFGLRVWYTLYPNGSGEVVVDALIADGLASNPKGVKNAIAFIPKELAEENL